MVILLTPGVILAWVAQGLHVLWAVITLVSIISIVTMISHFVPRKEY